MEQVTVTVFKNKKAKGDEPLEWINLRELWLNAGYKIPYHRWAKYQLVNFGLQPRVIKQKTGGRGQPRRLFFIPLCDAGPLFKAVERRRHCEISIIRKIEPLTGA